MRATLTPLFILICANLLVAQWGGLVQNQTKRIHCISDELRITQEEKSPAIQARRNQLDREIQAFEAKENALVSKLLPVVVHIVHQNGAENISDAQVESAIDFLNAAFSNTTVFQSNTGFQTEIQFCLAQQSPNGQASLGINRVLSPLTAFTVEHEDEALKNLSRWNPDRYINIWVVNSIESLSLGNAISGYAFLPTSAGTLEDGLVCEADFFGTTPARTAVLIHEMGHYLGLYHTFEGACLNDNCQTQGDHVCDTPPDRAQHTTCPFNSCHTDADAATSNPFQSDVDDFTENFMDYSPLSCYRSFTVGQAQRMHAAIALLRSNLLDSKGCLPPCTVPVAAAFQSTVSVGNVGENITFQNLSTGANRFTWLNSGQVFSNLTNPTLSFPSEGLYPIWLFAENNDPQCIDSFVLHLQVVCPVVARFSFENRSYAVGDTIFFKNTSQAATSFTWAINGQNQSQTSTFFYVFQNAGPQTLSLLAENGFCSDLYAQQFTVLENCQSGICPEICENGLDDDNDGYIDCYDIDCACFFDESCIVPALTNNFSIQLSWQSEKDEVSVDAVPLVANLNPQVDSLPEIIAMGAPTQIASEPGMQVLIFQGNGSDAATPCVLPIPRGFDAYPMTHPTIGDVDGNGIPELILVEFDGLVRVYRDFDPKKTPCMDLWITSDKEAWSRNARPTLADFDGDGVPEVYTGNVIFKFDFSNPNQATLMRVLEGTGPVGQVLYRDFQENATASVGVDVLNPADCLGDPDCAGLELVAGSVIYSVDLDDTDGDGFELKVQKDLNILVPNQAWKDGYTAVADMDLDGTPDVVVSSGHAGRYGIYVWNKNGLLAFMPYETETFLSGSIPCIANVFDDKSKGFSTDFPEIIACSHKKLTCFNLNAAQNSPLNPFWWSLLTTDASGLTGSSVFDFNGDGFSEIVYRDEEHLRILYGGALPFPFGVDAERNWFRIETGSGTFDEYPIVADVDADGEAEIAVTGYTTSGLGSPITDYRGRLRIFGSGSAPWVPARKVWNQFNYFISHVEDDLKIPRTQQKQWLEFPFAGSGNRPFNGHLSQQSALDASFMPFYPVSDAEVLLKKVVCEQEHLQVEFEIKNLGSAPVRAGTPLQWYASDPRLSAASRVGSPWVLPEKLFQDSSKIYTVFLPISGNVHLFGVFNDDGSVMTPFSLANDFPSTDLLECNYENNIFEINYAYQTPILDLGLDQTLCNSSTFQAKANANFTKYHWNNGSTEAEITAVAPAVLWLDVWDVCGFHFSDTLRLFQKPVADLNLPDVLDLCENTSQSLEILGFDSVFWQPALLVDCVRCAKVQVSSAADALLSVTVLKNDCIVSDTISIRLHANPVLTLNADSLACAKPDGATLSIEVQNGQAPYQYLWSNGHQAAELQTLFAGLYSATVSDAFACSATLSHTLANMVPLLLKASLDTIGCFGETGAINLGVLSGFEPIDYLWSTGHTTASVTNLPVGTYIVWAEDAHQCSFSDTIKLTQPAVLSVDFQTDTLNCAKDKGSILALPSGGTLPYTLQWFHGPNQALIENQEARVYKLSLVDANACALVDTVVFPMDTLAPVFDLQADSVAIPCNSDAAFLQADISLNDPNLMLPSWRDLQNGEQIWSPNRTDLEAFEKGWYVFLLENAVNFCKNVDSVFVFPAPKLDTAYGQIFPISCYGNQDGAYHVQSIIGGNTPFSFQLNDELTQESPIFSNLRAGTYNITLEDVYGCTWASSFEIKEPLPFWVDIWADRYAIELGQVVHLGAEIFPKNKSLFTQTWQPTALFSTPNALMQSLYVQDTTEIVFQVVDSSGCVAEDRLRIDVAQVDVFAPNIMQPTSNTEAFFTLYSARDVESIVLLQIFNRWGSLVFEHKDFSPNNPFLGWDGKVGGKYMDNGVYVWKSEVLLKNGDKRRLQGDLTLIR